MQGGWGEGSPPCKRGAPRRIPEILGKKQVEKIEGGGDKLDVTIYSYTPLAVSKVIIAVDNCTAWTVVHKCTRKYSETEKKDQILISKVLIFFYRKKMLSSIF